MSRAVSRPRSGYRAFSRKSVAYVAGAALADGGKTLVNRLVSPVRVPDVTRPFTVQLPGVVHRYEAGHRLEFVIAASDSAYSGNRGIKPVTVVSVPEDTGVLELPAVGGRLKRRRRPGDRP